MQRNTRCGRRAWRQRNSSTIETAAHSALRTNGVGASVLSGVPRASVGGLPPLLELPQRRRAGSARARRAATLPPLRWGLTADVGRVVYLSVD